MYIYKLNNLIRKLIILFSIVLLVSSMNAKTKEEFIGVIIEVSSKKEKIKLNDNFFLTYKLINRSDRKISLFIKDIENNMYLQFIGEANIPLPLRRNIRVRYLFEAESQEDFVEISKGDFLEFKIEVIYKEGKVSFSPKNIYDGKYLFFPNTNQYIVLNNIKTVFFNGKYKVSQMNIKLAKTLGVHNLFQEEAFSSNNVELKIE